MMTVAASPPAFIFDLDGTLVDSVYQHVLAWRQALEAVGVHVSSWSIHRRIGMSDVLLAKEVRRETGQSLDAERAGRLRELHTKFYLERAKEVQPLPGAGELLRLLAENSIKHAIATSSSLKRAGNSIEMIGIGPDIPVVTLEQVSFGKPDPDLFLAAMEQLHAAPNQCIIIGDSTWDILAARRAGALGVGVLTGGYPGDELFRAGAFRVYRDPADLMQNLDELGVHIS